MIQPGYKVQKKLFGVQNRMISISATDAIPHFYSNFSKAVL